MMKKRELAGRVALVTGGAVRIGRAIVEALAAQGCGVVIHCQRSVVAARALAVVVRAAGGRAWVLRGAMNSADDGVRVLRRARRMAGRLDIVVNNAARYTRQPLRDSTQLALAAEFGTNLFAPFGLTMAFARDGGRGVVINLLDRRIASCESGACVYTLTKLALAGFTRLAALELAPQIRVNAVAPGPVLPPPGQESACLCEKAGNIPLLVQPTAAQVAEAVVALVRMESVTGQILYVDGGQHLL
ncbi:MAG: SDR family NAD(P)-dependent oxidoreductase [bacterium]